MRSDVYATRIGWDEASCKKRMPRTKKEGHGQPLPSCDADDAMPRGKEDSVGPALKHVTQVDDEGALARGHVLPRPVRAPDARLDLQTRAVIGCEDCGSVMNKANASARKQGAIA